MGSVVVVLEVLLDGAVLVSEDTRRCVCGCGCG